VSHESRIGEDGYRLWMFELVRLSADEAAPYLPPTNLPPGNAQPRTSRGVVTRIIRSTEVSRAVKALHKGACQVCGEYFAVPGGNVAEGAHIRALGGPHRGPDVPANVLCLCPTHHSMFDAGGIYVDEHMTVRDMHGAVMGPLKLHSRHPVSQEHLGA